MGGLAESELHPLATVSICPNFTKNQTESVFLFLYQKKEEK